MPRSLAATGLALAAVFVIGLVVALPAHAIWAEKQQAETQGQDLAGKVLAVCAQGGDAAAPLVAISACPLAQKVRATSAQVTAAPITGLTPAEVQSMIQEEVARRMPPAAPIEGGGSLGPELPPVVAGQLGEEHHQRPAPDQVRSTNEERPPSLPIEYPARDQRRPERRETVTETAPAPVTVTAQAPTPQPVTQTVNQPQQPSPPAGTPLLNGLGGLLTGLGSGL